MKPAAPKCPLEKKFAGRWWTANIQTKASTSTAPDR